MHMLTASFIPTAVMVVEYGQLLEVTLFTAIVFQATRPEQCISTSSSLCQFHTGGCFEQRDSIWDLAGNTVQN